MSQPKDATERTIDSYNDCTLGLFMGQDYGCSSWKVAMPKHFAQKVAKYVMKHFGRLVESEQFQTLKKKTSSRRVAHFEHSQFKLGEMLGEGGFSTVYAIKKSLSNDVSADKYVVKTLRQAVLERPSKFASCALGLAKEEAILGSLDHPHIIKLRASSLGGLSNFASGRHDAYFLILDRLEETLNDRLLQWIELDQKIYNKKFGNMFLKHRQQKKQQKLFLERYRVGTQVASAVEYLHTHNILHRDLKPGNIGFDKDGNVKLFDFDISRLVPEPTRSDETFDLTMMIGTRRYMSPECFLGRPYNLKSDVYSFALVLHQILSLEVPFEGIEKQDHVDLVLKGCMRPPMRNSWPLETKKLIERSWNNKIQNRPTMEEIHSKLRFELTRSIPQVANQ